MEERRDQPIETPERGKTHDSEDMALKSATEDPRAHIEQGGEVGQAEEVQEAFTKLVTNLDEVPDLEPPPIVGIAEEEGTVKSMGDATSRDPAYLEAGGSRSDKSEIAKIDSFTEDMDKSTSGIINDPASLESGESQSGMGEIAKIDCFTEDMDKMTSEIMNNPTPLDAGGSRSGMGGIAKIISFTEHLDKTNSGIINDPAPLETAEPGVGISGIAKIDSFTDDPDKSTRTLPEENLRENRETAAVDSPPLGGE